MNPDLLGNSPHDYSYGNTQKMIDLSAKMREAMAEDPNVAMRKRRDEEEARRLESEIAVVDRLIKKYCDGNFTISYVHLLRELDEMRTRVEELRKR